VSEKSKSNRTRFYTLLQVGKQQLRMDDDAYRAFLAQHGAREKAGRVSATTMSIGQLMTAIEAMKRLGFTPTQRGTQLSTAKWRHARIAKLNALWTLLADHGHVRDRSEAAMQQWCRNQVAELERLEWADGAQLNKAIEALKRWCHRVGLGEELDE